MSVRRCGWLFALGPIALAGCAIATTPSDGVDASADATVTDAPDDSAWCHTVTCETLYTQCHAGICVDRSAPCFDTLSGVCSTYTCTIACDVGVAPEDAGTDAGPCGNVCQPCCPGYTCDPGWACNGRYCQGGVMCDAGR